MIGTKCFLRNGKIVPEREQEGHMIDVDRCAIYLCDICPCCRGVGHTPYGEPVTEAEAEQIKNDKIGDLEPCDECKGEGTLEESEIAWAEVRAKKYFDTHKEEE